MQPEPQAARIVERITIAKFNGDPPTPDHPKEPVEVITIDRRDGRETVTIDKRGED